MALYRHKRTGDLYRAFFTSFDVSRQEQHTVYMQLKTGAIFNRCQEKFLQNFECVGSPQSEIIPKEPHE